MGTAAKNSGKMNPDLDDSSSDHSLNSTETNREDPSSEKAWAKTSQRHLAKKNIKTGCNSRTSCPKSRTKGKRLG